MLRRVLAAISFAGLTFFSASARADGYSPQVGRPHPDFTLPRLADRSAVRLSQFRGRKILLIHFASW